MEPNSIGVSAKTGEGIDELLTKIAELLPEPDQLIEALIPYSRGDLVSKLHLNQRIDELEHRESGTYVKARVKPELAAELAKYSVR